MGYFFAMSFLLMFAADNRVAQAAALSGGGLCPDGSEPFLCLINPCAVMLCAEGYKCEASYCGGCEGNCVPDIGNTLPCHYNGQVYLPGDSFNSTDGCNTCFCSDNGSVGCSKIYCPTCSYNGQVYHPGDNFDSTDGCNTCSCSSDGSVVCTKIYCPQCPVYKCKACANGYVIDSNGCQTCKCKRNCGTKRRCGSDEFCMNGDCCPNWVLSARCASPCSTSSCPASTKCEPYCNCFSRCV